MLAAFPSIGMQERAEENLPPYQYAFKICEPDGLIVQKQIANNLIWLYGFYIPHQQGINGQNMTIAF